MSVASKQDQFKLATLKAMAEGTPYQDASGTISAAEEEALAGQASDNAAGITKVPPHIAGPMSEGIVSGSNAVQNYLGEMQGVQAEQIAAQREAMGGYAPPPIRTDRGDGGGTLVIDASGLNGLSEDELALKPQLYPEEYGGGLRYGGARTQSEATQMARGLAGRYRADLEAEDLALDESIANLQAGRDRLTRSPYSREGLQASNRTPFFQNAQERARGSQRDREESAQRGRHAEQAAITAERRRINIGRPAPQDLPSGWGSTRSGRASVAEANLRRAQAYEQNLDPRREQILNRRQGVVNQQIAAAGAPTPAEQQAIDREKQASIMLGQGILNQTRKAEEFTVPEDYELQRRAAEEFGWNPYVAEGYFEPPTDAERNADIANQIELEQRMANGGYLPQELTAEERALAIQQYGGERVEAADRVGVPIEDYMTIISDPGFEDARTLADQTYDDTGGDLDQIELALQELGLSIPAIRMILDSYTGQGLGTSESARAQYEFGG